MDVKWNQFEKSTIKPYMKTIQELNEKKILIVRIDNSLKKYKTMPIFQDKVYKANEILRNYSITKNGNEMK